MPPRRQALPYTEVGGLARKRLSRLRGEVVSSTGEVKQVYPGTGRNRAGIELDQPRTWSGSDPFQRSAEFITDIMQSVSDARMRRSGGYGSSQ